MRHTLRITLLILALLLIACGGTEAKVTPPSTNEMSVEPTRRPALSEPTILPEVAASQTEILVESTISAPILFETSWQDREIFRAGLVTSEQGILDQLPGASVYHLDLQIAGENDVINGRQQLLYTNQENTPLYEIYFHLFPNLLGGSIEISNVLINGETVVPIYESFNDSEMRLPLTGSLRPGEQVVIQLDFVTTVPLESGRNYGVLAYVEDILALAHFYPQVAVYDDEGWNIETPAEGGDVTYADVGFYLVRVTAPADLVVATGGVEIEQIVSGDAQTTTYAGGPMRDFYLAASDRYEPTSQTVGEITINSYAPAEYDLGSANALSYAMKAVESYSGRFAPYPFTELDIVATPTLALGVEYPGIIVNRLSIYGSGESASGTSNRILLESTTAHEVGHQWFYSLVGNDQLDEPWLDESLTQYATNLYYFDQYGPEGGQAFYRSLEDRWNRTEGADIPIGLPVSAYSGSEYGSIIYGRGPIFFTELAQTMGQESFNQFLRDYTEVHKWGIATTASLRQMAEAHCNCDLTSLFETWVYPP